MVEVKRFVDGSILSFGKGSFDNWCVFYKDLYGNYYVPRDEEYFAELKNFAECYGAETLYNDFVNIYEFTTKQIDNNVLKYIENLSKKYNGNELKIEILFTIIYMAMIAEENKENTVLGKKIKRLGIHQLLLEDYTPENAATFSCGMKATDIKRMCFERGF